ncbi:MAG: tRNA 2-thiouridine(34) synthase MnmA, partial [Candidatus Pacebacteria bacterium]|nr:tRNA 2-thiouridine(34) synthase MnmA [Candidatus Paceibacterota bacterium]
MPIQENISSQRVALGLSGGVDSALAAHLLQKQEHNVTAVYLECWNQPGCRAEQDRQDALKVALQLDIPFKVLDFKQEYQNQVMVYFVKEYQAGRTPNPDVLCNQVVKFGLFYDWAKKEGFDAIATGHYAQIGPCSLKNQSLEPALLSAVDLHKDQTYFLHQIKQKQLKHVLFPIGHLTKKQVRQKAKQLELPVWDKKDSVGICFVGEINVAQFLKKKLGENPGEVVDENGNVVGEHKGLWFYTLGQRKGFRVKTKAVAQKTNLVGDGDNLPPLYVIGKKPDQNQLVIGTKPQTKKGQFQVSNLSWIYPGFSPEGVGLKVRIRHTGE